MNVETSTIFVMVLYQQPVLSCLVQDQATSSYCCLKHNNFTKSLNSLVLLLFFFWGGEGQRTEKRHVNIKLWCPGRNNEANVVKTDREICQFKMNSYTVEYPQ